MSAEARSLLSPRQRLALSREALVAELEGGRRPRPAFIATEDPVLAQTPDGSPPDMSPGPFERFAWSSIGRGVLRRWWRRHPANAAGQLARPVIERYAREQPAKLVALSATGGALLVLVRPWRLLSLASLVALALKTSDVADLVTTLIQNNAHPRKEPTP